jgi:hypothetical protein
MLPTIHLNHQQGINAGEVGDEVADRVLAAESCAPHLLTAQRAPQAALGVRRLAAQFACAGELLR